MRFSPGCSCCDGVKQCIDPCPDFKFGTNNRASFWTFEISGVGYTDPVRCTHCDEFSGIFTIAIDLCIWISPLPGIVGCPNGGYVRWLLFFIRETPNPSTLGGWDGTWYLGREDGYLYGLSSSEFNCTGPNVMTLRYDPGYCSNIPSTITINPM